MHTFSSEHRLLYQHSSEGPRAWASPEKLHPESEAYRMLTTFEQQAEEYLQTATPEEREEIDAIADQLLFEKEEIDREFFNNLKLEQPKLGRYCCVGGPFGNEDQGVSWNGQDNLHFDPQYFHLPQYDYPIHLQPHTCCSMMAIDKAGIGSFVDIFGEDADSIRDLLNTSTALLDVDGIHNFDPQNPYVLKQGVAVDTNNKLQVFRSQIGGAKGAPAASGQNVTRPNAPIQPVKKGPGDTGVRLDEFGKKRVGNTLLPEGWTEQQLRDSLAKELKLATNAYEAQLRVVHKLTTEKANAQTLEAARRLLINLDEKLIGIQSDIVGLDGKRVKDLPQKK